MVFTLFSTADNPKVNKITGRPGKNWENMLGMVASHKHYSLNPIT